MAWEVDRERSFGGSGTSWRLNVMPVRFLSPTRRDVSSPTPPTSDSIISIPRWKNLLVGMQLPKEKDSYLMPLTLSLPPTDKS